MNELQVVAHWLYDLDFNTTAITEGKKPGHGWENWQTERQTLDDVNRLPWRSAVGVGVISGVGGFREFDFDDCPDFAPVATALDVLGLPSDYRWLWRSGSGKGYGLAVICHDALPSGVLAANGSGPGVFKAQGRDFDHLELRWERCQTIIPPSKHPAGPGYKWLHGTPTERPAIIRASQAIGAFLAVTVPKERKPAATAPAPRQTGDGYGAAALRDELDTLSRATEGTRNDSLNRAAYNLGQLVAGGELNRADVESQLLAVALRIGLGERESLATIASGLDAGSHEPRSAPNLIDHFIAEHLAHDLGPGAVQAEPADSLNAPVAWEMGNDGRPTPARPTTKPAKVAPKLVVLSIRELLTRTWPEPAWAVPGLLPVGLTVIAGRPKIGKSWLCLQLAQAVATGGVFLGQHVQRGRVLYLALEDPPRRLAERAKLQGWTDLDAQADFLTVGNFQRGNGRQLAGVTTAGGYRLVIVDTLGRAFAGDKDSGDDMTTALTPIQEAAHAGNCAVVVIHHHNKLGAATTGTADGLIEPDPLVNLQGSISIGGMADCIMGMYRQADKRGVLLCGYGRDVEEFKLNLSFDRVTRCWQAVDAEAPKVTDERAVIIATLDDLGPSSLTELNKVLRADKGNLYKRLQNMVNLGMIERDEKGRYSVPEA